ncbi:MAG TPA: LysE family translocator [Casimicrobiaceae bacterium]|jgi:threonine/homoserine/homoserine lactone efflux protein
MFGTHDFLLFVAAGVLLNITPGPDMLYIIGRSSSQGWRAGAAAALGIGAGCVVHIVAAALGLSAILAASATAFALLKIIGAAYLVYVGVSLICSSPHGRRAIALGPAKLRTVFVQGFLTNVLNPKVALFFLAFLPQFIDADAPSKPLAFLFLGAVFNFNGTLWNLLVAWSAARFTVGIERTKLAAWFNRCIGGLFVYLGVRLVFAKQG